MEVIPQIHYCQYAAWASEQINQVFETAFPVFDASAKSHTDEKHCTSANTNGGLLAPGSSEAMKRLAHAFLSGYHKSIAWLAWS